MPTPRDRYKSFLMDLDDAIDQHFFGKEGPKAKKRMSAVVTGEREWSQFFLHRIAAVLGIFRNVPPEGNEAEKGWSSNSDIVNELTRVAVKWIPAHSPPPSAVAPAPAPASAPPSAHASASSAVPVVQLDAAGAVDVSDNKHWCRDFWATHKTVFPIMWQLTRIVLATPASSVPVESQFSVLKSVDSAKRGSHTTERLGNLTLANMMRFIRGATDVKLPKKYPDASADEAYVPGSQAARHPSDEDVDAAAAEAADAAKIAQENVEEVEEMGADSEVPAALPAPAATAAPVLPEVAAEEEVAREPPKKRLKLSRK